MRQPFRLLVTGSRTWDDTAVIEHALAAILARHPEGVLLVHGACPPRSRRHRSGLRRPHTWIRHRGPPGGLGRHGRAAGQLRNAEMVRLGAQGCAAFLRGASPGTTATIRLARAAGIPVWVHTQR